MMEELSLSDINKRYVEDYVKWCAYAYFQTYTKFRISESSLYVDKLNSKIRELVDKGFIVNYKVELMVEDFNFKKYKRNLVIDNIDEESPLDTSHLNVYLEYRRGFGMETLSFDLEKKYEIIG